MDKEVFTIYIRSYKLHEKRLKEISEYVAISKLNFDTFSDRFILMFLSVCSEVDSVADEFCKKLGAENPKERYGINNKVSRILADHKDMKNWLCLTRSPYECIKIAPFANFKDSEAAGWWKDYNSVKHNRTGAGENGVHNFRLANLKNVLYAMAAFFLLLCKLCDEAEIDSELFEIEKNQ